MHFFGHFNMYMEYRLATIGEKADRHQKQTSVRNCKWCMTS